MKSKFKVADESNRFLYALCPFHKDTKPSLCINRVPNRDKPKGYYYCFGCKAFGEISSAEVDELSKNIVSIAVAQRQSRTATEWQTLHGEYFLREFRDGCGVYLAEKWNVSPAVITELGIGWDSFAHTIPMYKLNEIVGIQRQFTAGFKCMVSGSQLGLIVPMTMATGNVLFIPEGASDLAVLLDMGYCGIARPNALVGKELVYNWLKRCNPEYKKIIIVSDSDKSGIKGSKELQDYIDSEHIRSVILIPEEGKDLREWVQIKNKEYVQNAIKNYL